MVKVRFPSLVLIVVLIDQLTKLVATKILAPSHSVVLIPGFLSFTRIHNSGAGFGMLQGQRWLLVWISVIVLGVILYYYEQIRKRKRFLLGAALIFAGALGNLIDRIILGFVVDFINFSFWPAFNMADSAITIGACLLLFEWIKK